MEVKKNNKNVTTKIMAAIIIIIGVIYLSISVYLQDKFMPGTVINGYGTSLKTIAQAEKMIKADLIHDYSLEMLKNDGFSEYLYGNRIDLNLEIDLKKIKEEQNSYTWPMYLLQTNFYMSEYDIVYNKSLLASELNNFSFLKEENMKEPMNAYISNYIPGKGYEIVEEKPGNYIDKELFYKRIEKSICNLDKQFDITSNNCYEKPVTTKDSYDLKNRLGIMNQAIASVLTYDFDNDEIVLKADDYHTWLSFEDEGVIVDEKAAAAYVDDLIKNTDTAYTERTFETTSGREVKVTGPYGYRIAKNDERTQLIENILSGKTIKRKPVYTREGATRNGNDYGNTYVEIDLTGQKVYLYVNGELIKSSNCVTGNVAKNHTTLPGIYQLTYKQKNAVLRGPGYASPVKFWMPFNGGIGLHDASWRSTFGKSIYKTNGSHGCINLPYDMAKTLYENIYAGIPVICYN